MTNKRPAFTLVELIISIALVVVLIAGISQVFTMTSDTVGAGQAISSATRDNRAAQSVFYNDMKGAVTTAPPAFIIRSQRQWAFVDRALHLSDMDADQLAPTDIQISSQDFDGDGTEDPVTELQAPATYNDRSHRIDKLLFFARDLFPRQTGGRADDVEQFIAPMSATEAYVWYGHLRLPDFTQPLTTPERFEHRDPGAPLVTGSDRNDLNFYAANWTLGRVVMLMRQPAGGVITDDSSPTRLSQYFLADDEAAVDNLAPFQADSNSNQTAPADQFLLPWHRYDLAGVSINDFLNTVTAAYPTNTDWFSDLIGFRYHANPVPTRPHSGDGLARTVPIFLPKCSQFTVEYSGDFVKQNRDPNDNLPGGAGDTLGRHGDVQDVYWTGTTGRDGVVDFFVDPVTNTRKTRWYGMPRDTNGDTLIQSYHTTTGASNNQLVDVVPLRDVLLTCLTPPTPAATPAGAPFEREMITGPVVNRLPIPASGNYASLVDGMTSSALYTVAWGPDVTTAPMPTSIRITVVLSDPNGRMATGQTFEYVIDLP